MTAPTRTAIAIARVSTDEQAASGRTSLDTQLAEIDSWAEREGYTVVDRIREEGVSVTGDLDPDTHPRPFWDAYSRLRDGEVDVIVFLSRDRLSRSSRPHAVVGLLAEARAHGDGLRFVQGGGTGDETTDFIMDAVNAVSVSQDASRRKEATRRGSRAKLEQGLVEGGTPPTGYRIEDHRYVVADDEAEVVRTIFRLYTGGRSQKSIAAWLNEHGVVTTWELRGRPRTSRGWSSS
ncbi:hypothetical protein LCGC14_2052200, partial [marine sediment metagenome]